MPGPLGQALIAHIDSVFVGPNGDYAAVLEALAPVSAAQAAWKPGPDRNSIWQIVDHLIFSKQWMIDMLEKGEAGTPSWGEATGDEAAWQAAVAELKGLHEQMKAVIERLSDADLMAIPVPEWNQTMLQLILSSGPAHDAHHSGQIDYLRGLQTASD